MIVVISRIGGIRMDSFQIGPFLIKFNWLFLLAGLFFTYIILDALLKGNTQIKKNLIYNLLSTCIMIVILTYKFSFLLFRPSILWENPLGILYFNSGQKGLIFGLILAIFYLFIKFRSYSLNEWQYWKVIVYGFVTFGASYYVVQTIFYLLI
jgi:prolipoprotein diacylglyceryltransferase